MNLFLIAHLVDRTVAISTDKVDSVVDLGDIVPVPSAPPQVRGLAALRSRVVTVISSRETLGIEAVPAMGSRRAVITAVDGHSYAILVRALDDVAPFELKPVPSGLVLSSAWRHVAVGVVDLAGEPTLAINLRALIPGLAAAA